MAIKTQCEKCNSEFLIINKEIDFYKEKDFPLPKQCPKCRLERRIALRNKKELFGYNCDKCGKDIVIAFDPPTDQEVYCKECFQAFLQANDCIVGYSEGAKKEGNQDSNNNPAAAPAQSSTQQEVKDPVDW